MGKRSFTKGMGRDFEYHTRLSINNGLPCYYSLTTDGSSLSLIPPLLRLGLIVTASTFFRPTAKIPRPCADI